MHRMSLFYVHRKTLVVFFAGLFFGLLLSYSGLFNPEADYYYTSSKSYGLGPAPFVPAKPHSHGEFVEDLVLNTQRWNDFRGDSHHGKVGPIC